MWCLRGCKSGKEEEINFKFFDFFFFFSYCPLPSHYGRLRKFSHKGYFQILCYGHCLRGLLASKNLLDINFFFFFHLFEGMPLYTKKDSEKDKKLNSCLFTTGWRDDCNILKLKRHCCAVILDKKKKLQARKQVCFCF